jgi:hypothetical protein
MRNPAPVGRTPIPSDSGKNGMDPRSASRPLLDRIFDRVAGRLEASTSFEPLEARGTLRLALKEAGLDAKSAQVDQMNVVLQRIMPPELEARGIDGASQVCERIAREIKNQSGLWSASEPDSPEDIFRRLSGRAKEEARDTRTRSLRALRALTSPAGPCPYSVWEEAGAVWPLLPPPWRTKTVALRWTRNPSGPNSNRMRTFLLPSLRRRKQKRVLRTLGSSLPAHGLKPAARTEDPVRPSGASPFGLPPSACPWVYTRQKRGREHQTR